MELLDQIQALRGEGRVGTTLKGKYRLDGLIGGGGMASVYSATHRNSKRFAVKVLHPELSAHLDLRSRFMREGYVANQVEHPGAVAVLDDDVTDDGAAFLVMELLAGETVADAADRKDGKLSVMAVIGIAYQLLDVLAAANTRGIVHRDIKPANLFVTREGQLKVLDFGVARLRDAQGVTTTHTGHTLGTPAFMAPEQALGRADRIDGRTDVWAVGATMFSLLSGHLVHEASTAQEQMVFAATKPARTLAEAGAAGVPECVAEIVAKALGFRREDRWQSAAAMRAALGEAYRELYGETPSLASLAAIVSAVAPPTSPSDPLAPTARADAIVSDDPKPVLVQDSPPPARSIDGTTTETRRQRAVRLMRVSVGASLLLFAGAVIGAWMMRTRPSAPDGASSSAPVSAASVTGSALPISASAEQAASVAIQPPPPALAADAAVAASSPAVVPPRPVPKPRASAGTPSASASAKKPAHDSFDSQ